MVPSHIKEPRNILFRIYLTREGTKGDTAIVFGMGTSREIKNTLVTTSLFSTPEFPDPKDYSCGVLSVITVKSAL